MKKIWILINHNFFDATRVSLVTRPSPPKRHILYISHIYSITTLTTKYNNALSLSKLW
jgi:hypothetical protein